jgi:hypothetical protein
MKLTMNVLAAVIISSAASLSTFAQAPAVQNGSNWNRAPVPANRPADFVRVTKFATDGSLPTKSVLVATHIGGPTPNQLVAVVPAAPVARVAIVATPVQP